MAKGLIVVRDLVLIVDDIDINRIILREILVGDYDIQEAADGVEAIDFLYNTDRMPSAVLLDIMMPGMNGFEVLELIKSNACTAKIPVLFITAADSSENESKGLKEGAVDYIPKPFDADVVKARVDNHVQLLHYQTKLEAMVEKKAAELLTTHERILETLATIIEYRNLESGTHIRRSCELTKILVGQMLLMPEYKAALMEANYESMIRAVSLHDIGKVGIPDSILLKPGRLTPDEFAVVKTHSMIGFNIIETIASSVNDERKYLRHCSDICRSHHERWDGTGYPDGLAGDAIPLSARVASLVDVYDALVNKRCYKPAYSYDEGMRLIEESAGTQFDPGVVEAMKAVKDAFQALEMELGDK